MRSLRRLACQVVAASLLLLAPGAWPVEADAAQLTLTWLDNATNELGFSVERSTGTTGTFAEVGRKGPGVTTHTDSTVDEGITYCYRVRAFNAVAYSEYSDTVCGAARETFGFAVVKIGTGSGTIVSTPAGINCGTSCSGSYASGTTVTLTATPAVGSIFSGWSGGGCVGTGPCIVTLSASTTVTATFALQPSLPVHGDFNGDGKADILWRNASDTLGLWFMNGTALSGSSSPGNAGSDWTVVGVDDFNGDGRADILWRHASGTVALWFMNGSTISGNGSVGDAGTDWTVAGVGDFNGDGRADILWRHTAGNVALWFLNGATLSGSGSPGDVGTDWTIVGVGDLNGDGRADILWRHTSGDIVIWLMNGLTATSMASLGSLTADWTVVGVGDFNGDGRADLLWRHSSGIVVVWLMNGLTVASMASLGSFTADWTVVGVGDFNGDGKADVAWRHTSGTVAISFMNGTAISGSGSPGGAGIDWQIQ